MPCQRQRSSANDLSNQLAAAANVARYIRVLNTRLETKTLENIIPRPCKSRTNVMLI